MVEALLEGRKDLLLGAALDRHDEGKAEFARVGVVQFQEPAALLFAEAVEPGGGLLGLGIRCQIGELQPPREVRMRADESKLALARRAREPMDEGAMEPFGRILRRREPGLERSL